MKLLSITGIICLMMFVSPQAQELNTPAPSPMATLTQVVGLTEVTVSYSRPGIKGREIFGGLVPYDELWRTGANRSTTIKFSDDVQLEGNPVPAGEYALFTIPGKEEWTVIISKNIAWGTGEYKKEDDVARFTVDQVKLDKPVERFTIGITDMTDSSADIVLKWAQTKVSFEMTVDTDSKVMKQIDQVMKNKDLDKPNVYYRAADYYFSKDRDMKQALEWVSKAIELNPDGFWMIRLKSRIQAEMGNYEEAIKTAELGMKKAEEAGNAQYVQFNKEAIAEWKQKL